MFESNESEWSEILPLLPNSHFMQSPAWAKIKSDLGWCASYFVWKADSGSVVGGAMILEKSVRFQKLPIKISIQYIPKGPLIDWKNESLVKIVLDDISNYSKRRKVIFTKMDPDVVLESDNDLVMRGQSLGEEIKACLLKRNWHYSKSQVQFQNTVWIDLKENEDQILAKMKQKTRYNIRLAEKKGVKIRIANIEEYPTIYKLYAETSIRDQFTIRSQDYYLKLWKYFTELNICEVLVAEYEDTPIAGLIMYYFGDKAYYVYGMSSNLHRNLMPTYLIQWEAIKRAKHKGIKIYDLWGAPTNLVDSDPMWGVYKFKLGLGGELIRTIGAWDFSSQKVLLFLYETIVPIILNILRVAGKKKTQLSIE